MSRRARLAFFAAAAAALAVTLGAGLAGLPSFGSQLTSYARMLNELAPRQRHVTDVVSAISFDYRGIDTLFEEFILLSAVTGISVLLRPLSDETRQLPEDKAPDRTIPPPSPAVWLLAVFLSSLLVLIGIETVTHGLLTPGGGFQAGVILASGLYVVYLGTNYVTVERFQPAPAAGGLRWGGRLRVRVHRAARPAGRRRLPQQRRRPRHHREPDLGRHYPAAEPGRRRGGGGRFRDPGVGVPGPDGGHPDEATMSVLAYGVVAWLFLVGVYGVVTSRNLIHLVVCLSVAQSATDILLLEIGYRTGGHAPVFVSLPAHPGPAVDAVMQALALTDVVVGAAVTALLLALAVQVHKRAGTLDPDALRATRD